VGAGHFCDLSEGFAGGGLSKFYQRSLQRVQDERDTAIEIVAYVRNNWYSKSLFDEAGFQLGRSLNDTIQLGENLDAIFIIRLFATFEGILKEHMQQHHPSFPIRDEVKVSLLIDRVAVSQNARIVTALCNKVHEVRQYHNSLVHPNDRPIDEITFTEGLARLARYVGWLPEPR